MTENQQNALTPAAPQQTVDPEVTRRRAEEKEALERRAAEIRAEEEAERKAAEEEPVKAQPSEETEPELDPAKHAGRKKRADTVRVVGRHLPHALAGIAAYLKTAIPTMESNQKAAAERCCKLIDLYLGRDNG